MLLHLVHIVCCIKVFYGMILWLCKILAPQIPNKLKPKWHLAESLSVHIQFWFTIYTALAK